MSTKTSPIVITEETAKRVTAAFNAKYDRYKCETGKLVLNLNEERFIVSRKFIGPINTVHIVIIHSAHEKDPNDPKLDWETEIDMRIHLLKRQFNQSFNY